MSKLEDVLGYEFQQPELLERALTHSSYANEHHYESYERLEFLGDSILGMVVAEYLYRQSPSLPEGQLTKNRAALVREENLVLVSKRFGLETEIKVGRGEIKEIKPSMLADVVEAVLAAVYLDGGIAPAKRIINDFILTQPLSQELVMSDYKTALQEFLQRNPTCEIKYELIRSEGPDHLKVFYMQVTNHGEVLGTGTGKNKKEAQQQAAKMAMDQLQGKS